VKIRVYYEDTDAGGIVYHSQYLNFCERARSEMFFSRGVKPFEDDKSGFVVRRIEADFKGMARLGDILEVHTETVEIKRSFLKLRQWITLEDKIVFEMLIQLAYIANSKPARIPSTFLEIIGKDS